MDTDETQTGGLAISLPHPDKLLFREITEAVIGAAFTVHRELVDEKVIVETKVAPAYNPLDEAQLINELKATGIRVGLLLNFGRREMQFRRLVF